MIWEQNIKYRMYFNIYEKKWIDIFVIKNPEVWWCKELKTQLKDELIDIFNS